MRRKVEIISDIFDIFDIIIWRPLALLLAQETHTKYKRV